MKAAATARARKASRWRRAFPLVAVLAAGCQHLEPEWREGTTEEEARAAGTASAWREAAMNRRWQQRPLSELKAVMGEPQIIMQIPGGGNPPGLAAVFGLHHATGCIDAFAMLYGPDPVIRVYHCR